MVRLQAFAKQVKKGLSLFLENSYICDKPSDSAYKNKYVFDVYSAKYGMVLQMSPIFLQSCIHHICYIYSYLILS